MSQVDVPRVSKFAVAAFVLGIVTLCIGFASWLCLNLAENGELAKISLADRRDLALASRIVLLNALLPAILSTIFALVGWMMVRGSRGELRGRALCFGALLAVGVTLFVGFSGRYPIYDRALALNDQLKDKEPPTRSDARVPIESKHKSDTPPKGIPSEPKFTLDEPLKAERINAIGFSSDGKILGCGRENGTVSIYDATAQKVVQEIKGHTGPVRSLTFSDDGKWLATGSEDGTVQLWDVQTWKSVHTFVHERGFGAKKLQFSQNSTVLASAYSNNQVRLFDVTELKQLRTLDCPESRTFLAFSVGRRIYWSHVDSKVVVMDLETNKEVARVAGTPWDVVSSDGKILAMSDDNQQGAVQLVEIGSGTHLRTVFVPGQIMKVALHSGGKFLAVANSDGVTVWDTQFWKNGPEGKFKDIRALAFSPDGKFLVVVSAEGLNFWEFGK